MQELLKKYASEGGDSPKYKMKPEQFSLRHRYGENKDLKRELEQARRDLKRLNQEIEEK